MDNSTVALVCGLTALGLVVVLLLALLMLRVLRFGVFGFANMIMRMLTEPKDEADVAAIQAHAAPVTDDDLRSLAKSLDFDEAVEKARREQQEEASDALIEPKPFVPDTPDLTPPALNVNSPVDNRLNRDQRFPRVDGGSGPIQGA